MQYIKKSKIVGMSICMVIVLCGCANYTMTSYERVEATNYLVLTLFSGEQITGTVIEVKPYQIILLEENETKRAVTRSSIRSIRLKQPVYDEFEKGISEPEITSVQTSKNTMIYGIGGGVLSFGVSFFMGSLLGESGNVVALTTGVGGVLGTSLFIMAGKNKDRQDAITEIRKIRKSEQFMKEREEKLNADTRHQEGEEEENIENLEQRREELLRKLKEIEEENKKSKKY